LAVHHLTTNRTNTAQHRPGKLFWFDVWNIERTDPTSQVCRVEVRAGKKVLKERWGIRTFDDVKRIIGDVVRHSLDEVRYLAPCQTDSSVSRHRLDPLWDATRAQIERGLFDFRAGLLPSQLREVERQLAIDTAGECGSFRRMAV
jgi:hypothetical protein